MADIPIPASYSELFGRAIDRFTSRSGISRLRIGSAPLSFIEASVQNDLRVSQDLFNYLKSQDLSNSNGIGLLRIGQGENVPRLGESPSFGYVTIGDSTFSKLSSNIFQGSAAPLAGSSTIDVADASDWPSTGTIYIGRGTVNFEGPLSYTSITDNTSYFTVNLSANTAKYHNLGESVVVGQGGNRTVSIGTIVQTQLGSASQSIKFRVVNPVTLPDGENEIENVLVIALKPGVSGNVVATSIKEFGSNPFNGATVTNPNPFSNGRSVESEESYRDRIRNARATRSRGTPLSILSSVIGVSSTEENKTIVSSTLISKNGQPSVLYIDDGSGYEEKFSGVGVESLVDSALGGEDGFKTSSRPIVKAQIITNNTAPFALFNGYTLTFLVGNLATSHTFSEVNYQSIGSADPYEIVADINADFTLDWAARTVDNGTKVVFFAKTEINETIQWVETTDNPLGLDTTQMETAFLYKNDRLLFKDGENAVIYSNSSNLWNVFTGSQTLEIAVDGTPAVVYTFTDQDFIDGDTGYTSISNNSLEAWVTVINNKIPGITCSVVDDRLQIVSNLDTSNRAAINIISGTLVANNVLDITEVIGSDKDYTLDRSTGEIQLTEVLDVGDKLTLGSLNSRAFIEGSTLTTANLIATANLWFTNDSNAEVVSSGLNSFTSITITTSQVLHWGYRTKITSPVTSFDSIEKDYWVIFWDTALNNDIKNSVYKVIDSSGTYVEISRRSMLGAHARGAAVKLNNGKIMAIGGASGMPLAITNSCEIFDPATKLWTEAASLNLPRYLHSACVLNNGKVLVVGGMSEFGAITNSCELYDPNANTWTAVGNYPSNICLSSVVALNSGNAISAGGIISSSPTYANTSYVFDIGTNLWGANIPLGSERAYHRAIKLSTGDVLIVGGETSAFAVLNTAEVYNGINWNPTANNLSVARIGGMIAQRTNNTDVIFAGGSTTASNVAATLSAVTNIYNIGTNTWSVGNSLANACAYGEFVICTNNNGIVAFGQRTTTTNYFDVFTSGTSSYALGVNQPLGILQRVYPYAFEYDTNKVLILGGYSTAVTNGISSTEEYDLPGATWSQQDPANVNNQLLTNNGISFGISDKPPIYSQIPAGNNYTASSFVNELNTDFEDNSSLEAYTYKTNKIRVRTNTYDNAGDVSLLAADVEGQKLGLPVSDAVSNNIGHQGSVAASTSCLSTPLFSLFTVAESQSETKLSTTSPDLVDFSKYYAVGAKPNADYLNAPVSALLYNRSPNTDFFSTVFSSVSFESRSVFTAPGVINYFYKLVLNNTTLKYWYNNDRIWAAYPYNITANDTFGVTVDEDTASKRFVMNMWRTLKPNTNTYSTTNVFKDNDNGNASLAVAFGFGSTGTDFADFAAFMRARTKSHPADLTRTVLWRYSRFGADGNYARFRYVLPTAPNSAVAVNVNNTLTNSVVTDVEVRLSSGALRTGYPLNSSNSIGTVCTSTTNGLSQVKYILGLTVTNASRVANVTTLTLSLPAPVTDHGIPVGASIYLTSNNVNFPSGVYVVATTPSTTTLTYADVAANNAAVNIGDISVGFSKATTDGGGVVVGDILYVDPGATIDSDFEGQPMRIASMPTGQILEGAIYDFVPSPSTVIDWDNVGNASLFTIFANGNQTATQIVTAVNALYNVANSTVPVYGTVIGNGTGVINQSTAEYESGETYYLLSDGLNYVQSNVIPGSVVGDYTFTFKNEINPSLAADSDWINEQVKIVPITTSNIINWFNQLAISGLSSVATITSSDGNTKPQIATKTSGSLGSVEVQGGTANSVLANVAGSFQVYGTVGLLTVLGSQAAGLTADSVIKVINTKVAQRPQFNSSLAVDYVNSDGIIRLSANDFYTEVEPIKENAIVYFERQGNFICVKSDVFLGSAFNAPGVNRTVRISTPVTPNPLYSTASQANLGTFTIVGSDDSFDNAFWIENANGIMEGPVVCDVHFLNNSSARLGDTLSVGTNLLGVNTQKNWTIKTVGAAYTTALIGGMTRAGATVTVNTVTPHHLAIGDYFTLTPGEVNFASGTKVVASVTDADTFTYTEAGSATSNISPQIIEGLNYQNSKIIRVDTSESVPDPLAINTAFGSSYNLFQIIEGSPSSSIKYIYSITPNQSNGSYVDIKVDAPGQGDYISANNGSYITALNKLNFSTSLARGIDGYKYNIGLLQEANKVVQGILQDPTVYPGVAAVGSQIITSAPLIKRIQVSVAVRLFSGVNEASVANNVKSIIASVINAFPHGQSIPISNLIAEIETVAGVDSVVIIAPTYDSQNDLIPVQSYERPKILDINTDITVTFLGESA